MHQVTFTDTFSHQRATLGRWFSWWWANKDLRKNWWSKLSSLVYSLMQTGRMPAASLFQSLASSSRNEAVAKIQAARSAEKKINEQKKNSHDEGGVEEHPPLLRQSLQEKEKKTKPNQARKILPSGQARKRWQTSLISPKKQV
jgi:hypothetical protein